jgi:hypothetical protein
MAEELEWADRQNPQQHVDIARSGTHRSAW